MMEAWYIKNKDIGAYNPSTSFSPQNLLLHKSATPPSYGISPLTNFTLNVVWNILKEKNLIIAIPDIYLRAIPLISYLYSKQNSRSVLVFTQHSGSKIVENPDQMHNRNYHLLNIKGPYLFEKIPIGICKDNQLDAKLYLPRISKTYYRNKYKTQQKKNFLEKEEPKIILYSDEQDTRINKLIDIVKLDERYLFSWEDVPGNDSIKLIDFLKHDFYNDWINTPTIKKVDYGKTIRVSTEKNSLSLSLNDEKTRVNLKIDDGRTDEFIVKAENGKLNIYDKGTFDNLNINLDIGLVIFENADRFIYSEYSFKIFNQWLSSLQENDVHTFIHFSNPASPFIKRVKESTDSFVIQFGPSLLRHNEKLKRESIQYFEKISTQDDAIISKYNLDKKYHYLDVNKIILLPPLEIGNIDDYFINFKLLLKHIDTLSPELKRYVLSLANMCYKLYNLSINPSNYKDIFFDRELGFRYYSIPRIIKEIKDYYQDENSGTRAYLDLLTSAVYSIYNELKESKRYEKQHSYPRISKPYYLIKIIKQKLAEETTKDIIIAVYSPIERNILKVECEKILEENPNLRIEFISKLNKISFDHSETILLLPGPLRYKYMSELLKPYKQILMLSYAGHNYEHGRHQVELFESYSQEREDRAMDYLSEIYSYLGLKKDGLFKDYQERKSNLSRDEQFSGPEPNINEISLTELIQQEIEKPEDHLKEEQVITFLERELDYLNKKESEHDEEDVELWIADLVSIEEETEISINLRGNKTYIRINTKKNQLEETFPQELNAGDCIILIAGDERKTMLELVLDIFDQGESINKHLISNWKEKVNKYISTYNLNYTEFHRRYEEKGGQRKYPTVTLWAKGRVIGPDNPLDLAVLGEVLDDSEMKENYLLIDQEVRYLRDIHKMAGRKINKIVRKVLKNEFKKDSMSFEEALLFEQISNNIYKITCIRKNKNRGDP